MATTRLLLQKMMKPAPFISYSRFDLPFVKELACSLRAAGMDPWLDLTHVAGGDHWTAITDQALEECTHCLVVVSSYSVTSSEVRREYEFALQRQKEVIPLLLQTANPPERLQPIQWIDFRVSYDQALPILLARLGGQSPAANVTWLPTPPRQVSDRGFVPLLLMACPTTVKVVSAIIFGGGFFKISFAIVYSVFRDATFDDIFAASFEALMTLSWMWAAYRAANHSTTLGEIVGVSITAIVMPLLLLLIDSKMLWPLVFAPLDVVALVLMLKSPAYRRWMTAYSVGFKKRKMV